ncbi:fas-associated factor 1-like [Plakobranchus ocellatus]|uniref:Fas-associated factor 1-like n=1 Tax=Plakobranchus ocellatus TaxID=259542 RepID=A0AAV3Y977_9GAST|nr:fas-associated factor 1-like [Plakobranchus ocellatus]
MAESRDQTLIDFQAVTGIDDFDLCTSILTQHDWNLERAVNSIMGFGSSEGNGFSTDGIGPSPAEAIAEDPVLGLNRDLRAGFFDGAGVSSRPSEHGASDMAAGPSYSSSPLNYAARMIHFNVEYRDKNTPVVLPDNETVGRIKEILEVELGVPKDKQELKGLVKRKVDDSTRLCDLYLPRENSLYLLTPQITNPTVNKSQIQEGEGTSQGLEAEREYMLNIAYNDGTRSKMYNLKFDCGKTVRDDKLYACGLNYPTHDLEMTKSDSTAASKAIEPEEMEIDSEDEDTGLENYSLEDDLFSQEEPRSSRRLEPLMPDGVEDEKAALIQFSHEFANRYGECHPQFFLGSLDDAIQESLAVKATERKLLAVYLHHDGSIFSNVFCSQLLCAEGIVNYLSVHFVTWAWDLTSLSNASRFIQTATRHFGSLAATQMRSYTQDQLPSLLLISRAKATNEVIDAIQGHVTLDEMMTRLIHAVEVFQGQKQADIAEEREREARELIKQEQDAAYQESLAADRAKSEAQKLEDYKKKEEMDRLMEEQRKVEDEKKEEEQRKEAISRCVASEVPPEPAENCGGKIAKLRFRVPGGDVINRRFLASHCLRDVLNFLTARGFHIEDYKVLKTYPKMDISSLDKSSTLESLKLFPQETLFLEER